MGFGGRRRRLAAEEGTSIVEIAVGGLVMAIAVMGVIGAMGSSLGLVGHARQRSSGTAVAQERLERAHNVAFADLGHDPSDPNPPIHNPDPLHPNNKVSADGTQYNGERLVYLATGGLRHLDDPFTVAKTEFTVRQYVTWARHSDSQINEKQKRVTVVVSWKFPVQRGGLHEVTQSTIISDGTVAAPPAPSVAAPPSAPPGGGGAEGNLGTGSSLGDFVIGVIGGNGQCPTDSTAPEIREMLVLSGSGTEQGYLNSTNTEIRFVTREPECYATKLYLKNATNSSECLQTDAGYTEVSSIPEQPPSPSPLPTPAPPDMTHSGNMLWVIPPGDGLKTICAYIRARDARPSTVWGTNVLLDQSKPTTPGSFAQTACSLNGNDRTVNFSWTASTDSNFFGYRMYRSVESGPFQIAAQVTALAAADTTPRNYSSVRYIVRAYDKAGNESPDSPILSYSKNKC